MKATYNKAELRKAFALVDKSIGVGSTLPVLGYVLFTPSGLTSSNVSTQVHAKLTNDSIEHAFLVPADKLKAALSIDSDSLVIEPNGNTGTIKAGRSKIKYQTLPENMFPIIDDISGESFSTTAAFHDALRKVSVCAAVNDVRYYLQAVFVEILMDGGAVVTATDGHRVATIQTPLDRTGFALNALLHRDAVPLLAGLAPGLTTISANIVMHANDDCVTIIKKQDGNFPDWRRMFHAEPSTAYVEADKGQLIDALGLTKLATTKDKVRPTKATRKADGPLFLKSVSLDHSEVDSEVPAEGDLELDTGINASYLAPMLSIIDGDKVRIQKMPSEALYIGDGDLRMLIMPMRI